MSQSEKPKLKIPGPEVGYTDLLDAEIRERITKQAEDNKFFPLRPSSAGACARKLAYDLMEYEGKAKYAKEEMEPNVYRLLNLGHSVEYSAIRNLELIPGINIRYKQQVVTLFKLDSRAANIPAPLIEGSMDGVLWSDEFKGVFDIKSAKDGFSVAYKTRWDETLDKFRKMSSLVQIGAEAWYADDLDALLKELNGDFLSDNLVQLNMYACSDFLVERGIDHAVIYKYGKNDSRHYEIRFKPSKKVFEAVQKKFNAIYQAVGENKPEKVERESFLGSARCGFCPYQQECWQTNALKEFFKTTPKEWPTDIGRTKSKELPSMFERLESLEASSKEREALEADILKEMQEKKIKKIKLDNGRVYQIHYLKSPVPHFELRRSKV